MQERLSWTEGEEYKQTELSSGLSKAQATGSAKVWCKIGLHANWCGFSNKMTVIFVTEILMSFLNLLTCFYLFSVLFERVSLYFKRLLTLFLYFITKQAVVRGTTNPALCCHLANDTDLLTPVFWAMAGDNQQIDLLPADAFTRIDPKFNQVVPWSLHTFPENFMQIVQPLSRNLANKERNKEIAR